LELRFADRIGNFPASFVLLRSGWNSGTQLVYHRRHGSGAGLLHLRLSDGYSYSPAMVRQNEAFTVICTYCNGGSASAGPFTMRISLNKGAETRDRRIASGIADATCANQDFDFAGPVGYEVTYSLEFDVNHEVQEFTTLNNKSAEANIILY
jgi:hypothetical protein